MLSVSTICEIPFFLDVSIVLGVIWYGYELLIESQFMEVFGDWQVSFEDECCPSGGDCNTSKMT